MLWAPWSRMTAQDIRPPTRCLEGPSAMAPLCLRNVKSAAYAGGAMNNSAWQEHRVCAMETGLQRKAGALLMRLRDARRGSLPLNLGHWELSKVFERWSYMTQDRGEAHASTQKGSQPRLFIFLRSLSWPPRRRGSGGGTTDCHLSLPLGRAQTQAALLPFLLCITWAAPLCL